jgi:hypothetical protein
VISSIILWERKGASPLSHEIRRKEKAAIMIITDLIVLIITVSMDS